MLPWFALLAVLGLTGWWWLSMRARETAVRAARAACQRFGVQLLDETVALRRLRPMRGTDGRVHVWRLYHLEFSQTGGERCAGHVALLGDRVMDVHLDAVGDEAPAGRNRMH